MDPISITITIASYIGAFVSSFVGKRIYKELKKRRCNKYNKKCITTLVIPSGYSRNEVLKFFRENTKQQYSEYYFWHIEYNLKKSELYINQQEELTRKSIEDPISYIVCMQNMIKDLFDQNVNNLLKSKKKIVLVVSNPEYVTDLHEQNIYIFQPSIELNRTIESRPDVLLLNYIYGVIEKLDYKRFDSTNELCDLIGDVLSGKCNK